MTYKPALPSEDHLLESLSWLMIAAILVTTVWLFDRWITPYVFALPSGACALAACEHRQIAAIACPGHDLIRVWPLPLISPRFEDPLHPATGQWTLLQNSV